MGYEVHRLDIDMEKDAGKLEAFLNRLGGELVSMVPNIRSEGRPSLRSTE